MANRNGREVLLWIVISLQHSTHLSTAFDVTPLIALRKGFIAIGLYHHTGSVNQCSKESQARSGGDAKEDIISNFSCRLHLTVHLLQYFMSHSFEIPFFSYPLHFVLTHVSLSQPMNASDTLSAQV